MITEEWEKRKGVQVREVSEKSVAWCDRSWLMSFRSFGSSFMDAEITAFGPAACRTRRYKGSPLKQIKTMSPT